MNGNQQTTKEDDVKPQDRLRHHVPGAIERGEGKPVAGTPEQYCKIRFVSKYHHGATAGLIFSASQMKGKTIADISRAYPISEFQKMNRMQRSPMFETWDEAFRYEFK